jgi:hypothetical protein
MIEDKETGTVIATPKEALVENTLKNTEARILQAELALDLDRVVLQYLKQKRERFIKKKT